MKRLFLLMAMFVPVMAGLGVYSWWESKNQQEVVEQKITPSASSVVDMGDYRLFKPAKLLNKFTLNSGTSSFSNDLLLGKWTFVMFGYTHCPDICPTTLTRAKGVYQQLKNIAPVQIMFVSADPLRDDAKRLTQYVGYFDKEFIGATANHDKLFPFAQNLLLPYGIIAKKTSEDYAVSHSASIALINPQGKLHAHFKPIHNVGEVPIVDMNLMADSFNDIVAKTALN